MARPSSLPVWATSGSITVPGGGKQAAGWIANDTPPYQYENWFWNLLYQWVLWLSLLVFDDGATFNNVTQAAAVTGNSTGATGLDAYGVVGYAHGFGSGGSFTGSATGSTGVVGIGGPGAGGATASGGRFFAASDNSTAALHLGAQAAPTYAASGDVYLDNGNLNLSLYSAASGSAAWNPIAMLNVQQAWSQTQTFLGVAGSGKPGVQGNGDYTTGGSGFLGFGGNSSANLSVNSVTGSGIKAIGGTNSGNAYGSVGGWFQGGAGGSGGNAGTGGAGVYALGGGNGGSSTGGAGVYGKGGGTSGSGVVGFGSLVGTSVGVGGVGTNNGDGVQGFGNGSGNGVTGYGGATGYGGNFSATANFACVAVANATAAGMVGTTVQNSSTITYGYSAGVFGATTAGAPGVYAQSTGVGSALLANNTAGTGYALAVETNTGTTVAGVAIKPMSINAYTPVSLPTIAGNIGDIYTDVHGAVFIYCQAGGAYEVNTSAPNVTGWHRVAFSL